MQFLTLGYDKILLGGRAGGEAVVFWEKMFEGGW